MHMDMDIIIGAISTLEIYCNGQNYIARDLFVVFFFSTPGYMLNMLARRRSRVELSICVHSNIQLI